ncbi:MAG: tryptophan synthase subunit beta, partial [Methanothrix sp.]|nr:tryptophan synthase subunit beta [Methanothrix sp.]
MKITTTSNTRFGRYGGQFVPETLMQPLKELAEAYAHLKEDPQFMRELSGLLADYVGRPTPLYHARSLSRELSRKVYLKRE